MSPGPPRIAVEAAGQIGAKTGTAGQNRAQGLLPAGTELRIERDVEARDSYDRLLLYLFAATPDGERFINLELVTRGYARPLSIEPNVRYRRLFVEAAIDAERNLRGLWRVCK